MFLPQVSAGDVSGVVEPAPDIGTMPVGSKATLTFGADFPVDATQSMAIILIDYDVTGFGYNGFTAEMDGTDISAQYDETSEAGSLTLDCRSVDPANGALSIEISFGAVAEGDYAFSWRYIYVAYQEPPNMPSTKDMEGETQARIATTYTITASAGAGGSISPTGDVIVAHGDDQTFTIIPDAGYHVDDVLVDGVSVGAVSSYTFYSVHANHTIATTFTQDQPPSPPGPSPGPIILPPPSTPTPEEISEMTPEEAAETLEGLETEEAADIVEELNVAAAADIVEQMDVVIAADIIGEMEPQSVADIFEELIEETAVKILVETDVNSAATILELVEESEAGDILNAIVQLNRMDSFSEVLLEMEENASAGALLAAEASSGARLVEAMAKEDLTDAARRVEAAVKLRVRELDAEAAQGLLKKAAEMLENVNTESLVQLFIEITNLPNTPETVAAVFEVMNLTKTLEVVSEWISRGALQELADVFGLLTSETLSNVYLGISTDKRLAVYPYLSAATIAALPSPAEFKVSLISILPAQVVIGEAVIASIRVSNAGDEAGNCTITLIVNGLEEHREIIVLEGGTSTTISFDIVKRMVGVHHIEVDGQRGNFTIISPPAPAEFEVSDLVLSPMEADPGEEVLVSVLLSNIGDEAGSHSVEVKVDGEIVESKSHTLSGGESTTLSFSISSEVEGSHTVEVDNLITSFEVYVPPDEATRTFVDVKSLILIGAIMAIIASLFYFRSRK